MPINQKLMQPSFSGGEFAPSLHTRLDLAKFATGLKKARNFIIHPHGGASNRSGLEFCVVQKEIPGIPDAKVRVIGFEHSSDVSYCLEFGHNYIRVLFDGGLVLDGLEPLEVVTPYPHDKLDGIKFIQSVDTLFLFHPDFPVKKLVHYAANDWRIENFNNINGPFYYEKHDSKINFNALLLAMYPLKPYFTCAHGETTGAIIGYPTDHEKMRVNDTIRLNQFYKAQNLIETYLVANTTVDRVLFINPVKGEWYVKTGGAWYGKITIWIRDKGKRDEWTLYREGVKANGGSEITIAGYAEEFSVIKVCVGGQPGTAYSNRQIDCKLECPSFYHDGLLKVVSIDSLGEVEFSAINEFQLEDEVDGGPSQTWQLNSWCERFGYPSCGEFYQDRLALGGSYAEPHAVWFSKTGDYVNFGSSSPLVATDSITVNMPSRKLNGVRNLVSLRDILAFTQASECSIGDNGGGFSPSSVKNSIHGHRGSSKIAPAIIGNRAIIIQSMGSVVRDFGYDYASDGFTGSDLSIYSTHLFKGFTIKEIAYQQEPDSLVWLVRSDGKALSLTYMKEQEIMAWSWHETQGAFEAVCSIPGGEQNDVYFVVKRFGKRYIERLCRRMDKDDLKTAFFVDSGLSYYGEKTDFVTGLDHLEGQDVVALCDTRVVKGLKVIDGRVDFPEKAGVIHVGLSYVADLETLNMQFQSEVGNSYNDFCAISKAAFSFSETRGGKIGADEKYLDPVIDLLPNSGDMGEEKELFNGEYEQTINSQFKKGSSIFYRQDDPLPTTILAITPVVSAGGS